MVGRAEVFRPRELLRVDVDGDDLVRAGQAGSEDGAVAYSPAADHRHRVAAAGAAGVERRADAGHHAAAQ
jgi:hypothetical protein